MKTIKALTVFRRLLRAQRAVFQNDHEMQKTATIAIRQGFEDNRNVQDPIKVDELLKEAEEAESFMRENVVQASLNDQGRYQVDATKIDEARFRDENEKCCG